MIRDVSPGMCSIFLPDEDRVVSIPPEHIQPIPPVRSDKVRVIMGEERDSTGVLLSIDGLEGVVNIGGDIKLVLMKNLCKVRADGNN